MGGGNPSVSQKHLCSQRGGGHFCTQVLPCNSSDSLSVLDLNSPGCKMEASLLCLREPQWWAIWGNARRVRERQQEVRGSGGPEGASRYFPIPATSFGEGNGTPLQYSCLENPMDRGAWWAAGIAESQTRLKRLSSSSSSHLLVPRCDSGEPVGHLVLTTTLIW